MNARVLRPGVDSVGAMDWDRRLFEALAPLPDGTTYNAYLIRGSEKVALLDTVDPTMTDVLMGHLQDVPAIDYIIAQHAEQDHSGSIPAVLARYPRAQVMATAKAKDLLVYFLGLPEGQIVTVADGETLSLGDKTLEFLHLPWVHWPDTMGTYLREERVLFCCDFFGSHIAGTDLYARNERRVYEAAKRYFAEIMMPFRAIIRRNLDKLQAYDIAAIAPGHGPVYERPSFIVDAYRDWASEEPKNLAVIPYISMNGSTGRMVSYLVEALVERGVAAESLNLEVTDVGRLSMSLVDAGTIVIGTPTVLTSAHAAVLNAVALTNSLRPKARFAAVIGSYGWATQAVDHVTGMMTNLKVELLEPVYCKGVPGETEFRALDRLAGQIAERHRGFPIA